MASVLDKADLEYSGPQKVLLDNTIIYLFVGQREHTSKEIGRQREKQGLWVAQYRTWFQDPGIVTWAEDWRLTNWATEASLDNTKEKIA